MSAVMRPIPSVTQGTIRLLLGGMGKRRVRALAVLPIRFTRKNAAHWKVYLLLLARSDGSPTRITGVYLVCSGCLSEL